jgi:outer membrane receptor protein involved in Fe transport
MRSHRNSAAAMLILLLLCGTVSAQTSRGTLTGTVSDQSGAIVSDATVKLTDTATNVTRETRSNEAGIYRFDAVNLGTYVISVEASGFAVAKVQNVAISANRASNIDVKLTAGGATESITVEATADQLQTTEQVRVENISARKVADLPVLGQNSLNLLLTAPGVITSDLGGSLNSGIGAVNGARPRSNSFLIDGVENNDISVAGPALVSTNQDAIQEISIQTSNFTAEFGRAGGAVVNQVTKSGTNSYHGTVNWVYLSSAFNAANFDERVGGQKAAFTEHIPSFTFGGPVKIPGLYDGTNRTFFFVGAQWDRFGTGGQALTFRVPTASGITTLQALATAGCSQAQLYLDSIGNLVAGSQITTVNLAIPAATFAVTGSCNGTDRTGMSIGVGTATRFVGGTQVQENHVVRFDHKLTDKQQFSARWIFLDGDFGVSTGTAGISEPFDSSSRDREMGIALNHTYAISNTVTNEFRFNYGRINPQFPVNDATGLGAIPRITFTGASSGSLAGIGTTATFPQGRTANNFQYQDVVTVVRGKHQIRAGVDYLRQLARQLAPGNSRGSLTYGLSTGVTGFANYLDDFSGAAGASAIIFDDPIYRPNLFRQAYFVQDAWKVRENLTINLGVRYENFGQPANIFTYPVVSTDPAQFPNSNRVKQDNNNFGPTVGFAYTPRFWQAIFGDSKTVIRGGYSITYDTFFNNLLSNMAAAVPNRISSLPLCVGSCVSGPNPRGVPNMSATLPALVPSLPTNPLLSTSSQFAAEMPNPYTMHTSLGIQRELPWKTILDVSYVGTLSRKGFLNYELNPRNPNAALNGAGNRLVTTQGGRNIRASGASANFNSLQVQARRAASATPVGDLSFTSAYTWSKSLDVVSEVFVTNFALASLGSSQRFALSNRKMDYGPSDFDVRHQWVTNAIWDIRGPKDGFLGQVFGGWGLSFIIPVQTGFPVEIGNGFDRDLDGGTADRPDVGNWNADIRSRAYAVPASICATGFQDVNSSNCVTANDVRWIVYGAFDLGPGVGFLKEPDGNTGRRNTFRTPGSILVHMNVSKKFKLSEGVKLEYRTEIFNLANKWNKNYEPLDVFAGAAGDFLLFENGNFAGSRNTESRFMRMGLKVIF